MASLLWSDTGRVISSNNAQNSATSSSSVQYGIWTPKGESNRLDNGVGIGGNGECEQDSQLKPKLTKRVEIIKSAEVRDKGGTLRKKHFVHEIGQNRRMDAWVDADEIEVVDTFNILNGSNIFLDSIDMSETQNIMTRKKKRQNDDYHNTEFSIDELDPETRQLELEYRKKTQIKYIQQVVFGDHLLDTWYFSPYPGELYGKAEKLFVCNHCLKYMVHAKTYYEHLYINQCPRNNLLPGRVIYYDEKRSLYVCCVDGKYDKVFCQNLNLFCKLFIDHKTVYFDIERFLFYILYLGVDESNSIDGGNEALQIAGYFSKEKVSLENFNLSCFVVLPPFQRRGFGRLLISISYYLSHLEGKVQGPETPLSDLGRCSYLSYWKYYVLKYLSSCKRMPNLDDLSRATGFKVSDLLLMLKTINAVQRTTNSSQITQSNGPFATGDGFTRNKGEHSSNYFISVTVQDVAKLVSSDKFKKPHCIFDPQCICL